MSTTPATTPAAVPADAQPQQQQQQPAATPAAGAAGSGARGQFRSARQVPMRYYEAELPELNELVHVKFISLTDNSAYVQLLEYAGIQGMITFSELHRGRMTSIGQYASVDREDIMTVIRLDADKRYIDLSKRTLKPADRAQGHAKAQRGRDVLNYMCTIADATGTPIQEMMERVAWPLYRRFASNGGALEALKQAVTQPEEIFGPLDITRRVRAELERLVQAKLKPKVRKYEALVSVTCNTVEGVESIKQVLLAGQEAARDAVEITVKASPFYMLRTASTDREAGLRLLNTSIEAMRQASGALTVVVEVSKEPGDASGDQVGAGAGAAANAAAAA